MKFLCATLHFLYDHGAIHNLNSLLAPGFRQYVLTNAVAINNKGWILGEGMVNDRPHVLLAHTGPDLPAPPARRASY